ncbi:MAG: Gfo/Idh/MocA family oxidoreductase [Bryobacterales bacterium]|nr:Gfo/Idh/MocA family oxidoreductase [Bryobacterales bacterium]
MTSGTTRRIFLGAATAASAMRVLGANDRVSVAIIGVGGRGSGHLRTYAGLPGARVAGICDVNQAARERAQTMLQRSSSEKAKEYADMREVFADASIDAVSTATPNHWHALTAIWAMKAGKDVYGEKPASHNIYEGLEMLKVARETKRMLQIGSQHRSTPFKIRALQAMHGGLIGDIYMTKSNCFKRRASIGRKPDTPVPAGVDWDMFCGPAPLRPFNELRFRYNWHWFWDTGNGDLGNQGVHEVGVARWGLGDPSWPVSVYAHGGKFAYDDDQETPNTLLATYDFGGRQLVAEVRGLLTGAEGFPVRRRGGAPAEGAVAPSAASGSAPRVESQGPHVNVMVGNLFYGTEGWAAMGDEGFQAFKGESNELVMEERPQRGPGNDTTGLHMQNFLEAVRSRKSESLTDEIGNAHLSAALCHLANISYRVGRKLTLAPGTAGMPKFVNDPEAEKLLTRDYRKPYVL